MEFNKVAEVKAADFTVTKGTVKANVANVAVAEDKKSATIELTSKLTAGEYKVTVAQADAEAISGTVTVENEKLAAIEILSNEAVITAGTLGNTIADDKAVVTIKISNQYGEDITKLNLGVSVNVAGAGTAGTLKATGEIDLTINDTAKIGENVILTIVDPNTGVSATKTLPLAGKASASEVAFGTLYNKDGKTLTQDSNLTKDTFYLPIIVKDQYGKEIVETSALGDIRVTVTDESIVKLSAVKKVKINDKDALALEVTQVGLAGTSNVVLVSITSGKSATAAVTVASGVKVQSLALAAPVELVTADKDVYFPLTVVDTAGNEVKTVVDLNKIKDAVTPSIGTIVDKNAKGEAGLFVKVDNLINPVVENTALTVTVTSTSGKVSTQTVLPKAKAVATVITGIDAKLATALRAGDTTGLAIKNTHLVVEDQYGQVFTDGALQFKVASDDTSAITVDNATAATSHTIKPVPGTAKTSAKITFTIDGAANEAASAFTKAYTIVKDAQFASYEIADVDPIKVETADGTTYTITAGYTKDFKVTAKTKDGATVTLDEGTDYSIQGVTMAAGKITNPGTLKFADKADTTTKIVTVVINNTGDELTKELTFSTAAPKAVKVESIDSAKKPQLAVNSAGGNTAFGYAALYGLTKIVATDQYGVKTEDGSISSAILTFSPVSGTVTFDANGTTTASVTNASAGAVVNAKVAVDGQSVTVKVTFDGAVDTVAPEALSATESTDAKKLTITFSEALDAATVVSANFSISGGNSQAGLTDVAYTAGSKTVTLTFDGALIENNAIQVKATVKDVAGNTITATTFTRDDAAVGAGVYTVS